MGWINIFIFYITDFLYNGLFWSVIEKVPLKSVIWKFDCNEIIFLSGQQLGVWHPISQRRTSRFSTPNQCTISATRWNTTARWGRHESVATITKSVRRPIAGVALCSTAQVGRVRCGVIHRSSASPRPPRDGTPPASVWPLLRQTPGQPCSETTLIRICDKKLKITK